MDRTYGNNSGWIFNMDWLKFSEIKVQNHIPVLISSRKLWTFQCTAQQGTWERNYEVEFRLYDLKRNNQKVCQWPTESGFLYIHPPVTLTQTWTEAVAQLNHSYPEPEWGARFAQWLWEHRLIIAPLGSVWSQAHCMAHGWDLQPLSPSGRDAGSASLILCWVMPHLPSHAVLQGVVSWGLGAFLLGKEKHKDAGTHMQQQNCYGKIKNKVESGKKNHCRYLLRAITHSVYLVSPLASMLSN